MVAFFPKHFLWDPNSLNIGKYLEPGTGEMS